MPDQTPTTAQDILNQVYAGLKAQGKKAGRINEFTQGFDCRYRDENGCKCAVGQALRDDEYNIGMEGSGVFGIVNMLPERLQQHLSLLDVLQDFHDWRWDETIESLDAGFANIAADHGLQHPKDMGL